MAFTVTEQKCSVRREKLRKAQTLLNELISLNETADRVRATLVAQGSLDVGDTVNKILAAGGPPYPGEGTTAGATHDLVVDGDTVTAELVAILSTFTGGISWTYADE